MNKYIKSGAIVKAIAGKEYNELFVVLKVANNYAYLVNGKSRKIENPKKKNFKHLFLLYKNENFKFDINLITNSEIIKILKDYNKSKDYK